MPSGAESVYQRGVVGAYRLMHRRYQHRLDLFSVSLGLCPYNRV
jgi:hypothetical protein